MPLLVVFDCNTLFHLMHSPSPDAQDFRTRFPDLIIVDPVAFLQIAERQA